MVTAALGIATAVGGAILVLGGIKAAFVALTGAATVAAGAAVTLKIALLAIPWVAAAAGIAALAVGVAQYVGEQKEMNELMNVNITETQDFSDVQGRLKSKIEETKNEIEKANKKLEDQVGKGKRGAAQAEVYRKENCRA